MLVPSEPPVRATSAGGSVTSYLYQGNTGDSGEGEH